MHIDKSYILPGLLLVLNLGSAAVCLTAGDYKRAVYWLASGLCIATVAFKS